MCKIFLLVISTTLLLSSCATTAKYKALCEGYLGKSQDDLVNARGYPNRTFEAPNGNKVLEYHYEYSFVVPGDEPQREVAEYSHFGDKVYEKRSVIPASQPQRYSSECTTQFEIDKAGSVVRYFFKGNDCTAK